MYYLCDYKTNTAIREYGKLKSVVDYINRSDDPELFCALSRHMLDKIGRYPKTKKGNLELQKDISQKHYVVTFPKPILVQDEEG